MSAAEDTFTEASSPVTTADIIRQMLEIRDRKREISAEEKELNKAWDALEKTLIGRMDEEGSTRVSSKLGTASLTEKIVPQIDDYDALHAWILETGNLYILQNRVAARAYEELVKIGQEVPGLSPFTKRDIGLRSS